MQKSKSLGSSWSCACAQLPHLGSTVGMKRVILSSLSRERIWITFHNYNCNNDFCIHSISLYFTPIVPGKFSLPHWYVNNKNSGNFRPPSPTCLDLAVNPFTVNGLSGCPMLIFCPNGRYKRAGSCVWPRGIHLIAQHGANLTRKDCFIAVVDSFLRHCWHLKSFFDILRHFAEV